METLDAALVASLTRALHADGKMTRPLCTALLGLIYLVQDDAGPALRSYLEFLLTDFPPLGETFSDDRAPFIGEHAVARRWVVDHTELLLHEVFLWSLVDRFNEDAHGN